MPPNPLQRLRRLRAVLGGLISPSSLRAFNRWAIRAEPSNRCNAWRHITGSSTPMAGCRCQCWSAETAVSC